MGLQYEADGPQDIGIQFSKESDAMAKAGFQEPDLSEAPEGFVSRTITRTVEKFSLVDIYDEATGESLPSRSLGFAELTITLADGPERPTAR